MRAAGRTLAAVLLLAGCADAPGPARQRRGYEEAARHYAAMLQRDPGSELLRYNLGSALLLAGRHVESRSHLEAATAAPDSSLRERAFYNLGNSHLEPAFARVDLPDREAELRRSIEAYKQALLLVPDDQDAKWNLELARLLLAQQPQGGGGGGGGGGDSESEADDPQPEPAGSGGASPELTPEAADRLLSGAQQRELGVQREKLRRPQPPNPSAH